MRLRLTCKNEISPGEIRQPQNFTKFIAIPWDIHKRELPMEPDGFGSYPDGQRGFSDSPWREQKHVVAFIQCEPDPPRVLREVDSACVFHNLSTRFADGGEFNFGAEIGISANNLHARGPMGLRELTSYPYRVRGNGQMKG